MQKSKMFFEDFEVGLVIKTGSKKITKKEIISFAKNYDPQDFHIDENKAKKGPFGTLVSSGFMTLGISFTQFFETGVVKETSMGAWGIDELRWTYPVYPDDELKSEVKVIEKVFNELGIKLSVPESAEIQLANLNWPMEPGSIDYLEYMRKQFVKLDLKLA